MHAGLHLPGCCLVKAQIVNEIQALPAKAMLSSPCNPVWRLLQAVLEECISMLVKHGPVQMGLQYITAHLEPGVIASARYDLLFLQVLYAC